MSHFPQTGDQPGTASPYYGACATKSPIVSTYIEPQLLKICKIYFPQYRTFYLSGINGIPICENPKLQNIFDENV